MKKSALSIVLGVLVLLPLKAEVYLLGPRQGRENAGEKLAALLPGSEKVLHSERITVNSHPALLEVAAVKGDMEEIAALLRKMKVSGLNISGGTLRFERKLPNGMKERYLLIGTRQGRPLTLFKMTLPEKLPGPEQWPPELPPLPPGAEMTAVTRLGDGGICGEFRNAREPAYILLRRVDSLLRNRKMYPAGNEIASVSGGRGEIFYDKNAIIWVNFSDSGHGAFFYRRRK